MRQKKGYFNSQMDEQMIERLAEFIAENLDELTSISTAKRQEAIIDILMKAERSVYLDRHQDDKANGYYQREIGSPIGSLKVNVPRVRDGEFRPQVLPPPYQRDVIERTDIIDALISASYTPSGIQTVLKKLGMHYSEEELKKLENEIIKEFDALCNKELPSDVIAIYIDAYKAEIMENQSIKSLTVFTVIGITFNGTKELFGFYTNIGNETKEFWLKVLNDIIKRGVKRPLIIISDDFSGIKDAVKALFPQALHQLCLVHLMRNCQRNTGKDDAKSIIHSIKYVIHNILDYDQSLNTLKQTFLKYKDKYPSFINRVLNNLELYIACFKLHPDVRRYFYSTNTVESFNSILEHIRNKTGGFFQSVNVLKVNVYINYLKIKKKWNKAPPPLITNIYYIKQLFAQIYGDAPII